MASLSVPPNIKVKKNVLMANKSFSTILYSQYIETPTTFTDGSSPKEGLFPGPEAIGLQ